LSENSTLSMPIAPGVGARDSEPSERVIVTPRVSVPAANSEAGTTFAILISLSLCHFLNDMNQSLVPAIYPILKASYQLDFGQIGLITLAFQMTASLLQPVVGMVTDKRPTPFSLPIAMGCSLVGLLMLSAATSYHMILIAAAMVGLGSSVFHPESSRVARMASGGRYGFAQSLFQLGGSAGSAIGPLLAAFIVVPRGQGSIAWFSAAALLAILVLTNVSVWYSRHPAMASRRGRRTPAVIPASPLPRGKVIGAIAVILVLLFSKNVYTSSLSSYYTFYLIQKFHLSVPHAQYMLFTFLGAVAAGTFAGGPIGDRVGRKPVIWFSILGAFPFALMLPCRPALDRHPQRVDRADPCLRLFRHHRLRAGTAARPHRPRGGHDVRLLVRSWRAGRRRPWTHCRCDRNRDGVPGLLVPAADRPAHRAAAEYRTAEVRSGLCPEPCQGATLLGTNHFRTGSKGRRPFAGPGQSPGLPFTPYRRAAPWTT
jgi:FSR family fosmidomycin resistance protein-like MFS transporter